MKVCQSCGIKNEDANNFCASCAAPLTALPQSDLKGAEVQKKSSFRISYVICSIIAIAVFVAFWPLGFAYVFVVSIILGIVRIHETHKPPVLFIILALIPVSFGIIEFIGANTPDRKLTQADYIQAAQVDAINQYPNLNLVPELDNASVSDFDYSGENYLIKGVMHSAFGGFNYNVEVILEISPDGTESRAAGVKLTQIN